MKIGIDKIGFYSSHYYLDLEVLAKERNIDVNKFHVGLGQYKMSVPTPGEDIITMAANAAERVIEESDIEAIDTILFATETAVDQAKAAGTSLKRLLNLSEKCRTVEIKQACYGGTAALQMAMGLVLRNPKKKVLVIAADISRYGLNKPGESTQGCAAVAMLISANPRLITIENEYGVYTEDIFDYWRPNDRHEGIIEGKYSTKMYLNAMQSAWSHYQEESGRHFSDHDYFLYHNSVPRLVEKTHKQYAKNAEAEVESEKLNLGLEYGRQIGNAYTAALYVSLLSLLDNAKEDLSGKRIAFSSYGSGCVAECFSGLVQETYRDVLDSAFNQQLLATREALAYEKYEEVYRYALLADEHGNATVPEAYDTGNFHLVGLDQYRRIYQPVKKAVAEIITEQSGRAVSPGKLILSGEHAVVYGKPAIAFAVNRYVTTTVTEKQDESVDFNLFDLKYHKSMAKKALEDLSDSLKRKYNKFVNGQCTIKDVLKQPFELAQFTAAHLLEHIAPQKAHGLKIETKSDIPLGCGMGSSAATALSVLRAITQYYHLDLGENELLKLAYESEQLQHGTPSELDLQVSLNGGCVYFHDGKVAQRALPNIPMFIVNTGQPDADTGECVVQVANNFAQDAIWDQFEKVTNGIDRALKENDLLTLQKLVSENHRLLNKIGVVPKQVSQFVSDVEKAGVAAKICGAGSVRGDHAGVVLIVGDVTEEIKAIVKCFDYTIEPLSISKQGLHLA